MLDFLQKKKLSHKISIKRKCNGIWIELSWALGNSGVEAQVHLSWSQEYSEMLLKI